MGKKLLKVHKVNFQNEDFEFKWYTVVTAYNHERKAAENIQKRFESMGFGDKLEEILVPIVEFKEVNAKGREIKKARNILESGYIFIKMIMNNDTWNVVRQTTGVAGWLNGDGRPAPVPESNILRIKEMMGLNVKEEKMFNGKVGDTVKVLDMGGLEARVTDISEDKFSIKVVAENGFKLELQSNQVEVV